MKFGGFTPFTLSDFKGCVAAIAFTQGCNFNCLYCHNRALIENDTDRSQKHTDAAAIMNYLQQYRHRLGGLVISGGEPTCQSDLESFVQEVKGLGLRVKLDTNGSHPQVLATLLHRNLLDYVALDVKAPWSKYHQVANRCVDTDAVKSSIALLTHYQTPHEFRVTAVSPLLNADDILEIGYELGPQGPLYLQKFRAPHFALSQRMDTTTGLNDVHKTLKQTFTDVHLR